MLDRVEERIDRFNEKVKIIETDDSAFNEEFPGIVDFLYEASDLPETSENILKRDLFIFQKGCGIREFIQSSFSFISFF